MVSPVPSLALRGSACITWVTTMLASLGHAGKLSFRELVRKLDGNWMQGQRGASDRRAAARRAVAHGRE